MTPPPAAAAAPQVPLSGTSYPFGARLNRYAAGILPTQSASTMDAVLTAQYDAWKAARIVSANSIVSGGYAVQFSNTNYMTVSEGMGYGMLLAVLFAGHDPQAQTLFDGLLAVVRARPAYAVIPYDANGKYLMDWRLNANGTSAGDGWNAMDGDLDIAMALLMADRQWGSAGAWNYLQEGKNTIAALKSWNMKADGTTKGLPSANNNRTSDYMIGHFRAFKAATGDTLWDLAVDRAYELLDRMQTVYSPGVGLMPDFVINTNTSTPAPSTGYIGDGNDKEGYFWWNACRNPWRFASDYLLSGDARFAGVTGRMIDFFKTSSGGDPVTNRHRLRSRRDQADRGQQPGLPRAHLCRRLRRCTLPGLPGRHVELEREPPHHRLLRRGDSAPEHGGCFRELVDTRSRTIAVLSAAHRLCRREVRAMSRPHSELGFLISSNVQASDPLAAPPARPHCPHRRPPAARPCRPSPRPPAGHRPCPRG